MNTFNHWCLSLWQDLSIFQINQLRNKDNKLFSVQTKKSFSTIASLQLIKSNWRLTEHFIILLFFVFAKSHPTGRLKLKLLAVRVSLKSWQSLSETLKDKTKMGEVIKYIWRRDIYMIKKGFLLARRSKPRQSICNKKWSKLDLL